MADLSDIKKAKMCALLKNELSAYDRDSRSQILYNSMNWALTQSNVDPKANGVYMWLQEAYQTSQHSSKSEFLHHYFWNTFGNHWDSPTMKAILHSILNDDVYSEEDDTDEDDTDEETSEEDEEQEEEEEEEQTNDVDDDENDTSITISSRRGYGYPFGYDRRR